MSFPTGLFVDAPEMQDASMSQMSEDTNNWSEELVQKLKERVPQTSSMSVICKFMKMDEENGTATGSLVVADNKKQAIIPIVIKDFQCFPLDIFIADKKLLPLTPDYFAGIFSSNAVFQKLEEYPTFGGLGRFEDANLWNATYPPSLGRYAYASAGYDILDQISDTIGGEEFATYLKENPTVAANLVKNGHAEVTKKLAHMQPVNMNEFRQGVENLINRPIVMLRKEGPNKYNVLANSDSTFSPAISKMNRAECLDFVSKMSDSPQDEINDVDMNGERMLAVPEVEDNILAKPVSGDYGYDEKIEMCNDFDSYRVKNKNGVSFEGYVIPQGHRLWDEPCASETLCGKNDVDYAA